jgi:hydroxymethylpyrimidine/phosphomethylpyrimidine kinase
MAELAERESRQADSVSAAGRMKKAPVVLAIGGLDPTGYAGLAADVRAGAAVGALVAPVAAALTVQGKGGCRRAQGSDPGLLGEQIAAALESLDVGAVKIGMLGGGAQARAVSAALKGFGGPWVLDPVLAATAGGDLAEPGLADSLAELFGRPQTLLTPNLPEAAALLKGEAPQDEEGMEGAAQALRAKGFGSVLLKGGHLGGERSSDYLADTDKGMWIVGARLDAPNTRGTGCSLATLVAALLARKQPLRLACIGAKNALTILLKKNAGLKWPNGAGPLI